MGDRRNRRSVTGAPGRDGRDSAGRACCCKKNRCSTGAIRSTEDTGSTGNREGTGNTEVPEASQTQEIHEVTASAPAAPVAPVTPAATVEPPKELADVLAQESDGQISLVMPEAESIEKQITGQMNIEDILAEWERKKKENLEKREEEVRQHVLQQTGAMFTEFEQAVRDGLLEKLEKKSCGHGRYRGRRYNRYR